jgi:glycosyltransferase involved in cell wall biosynthesis
MTSELESPVNGPLVSVVMSFLNGAKFIRDSVDSVLAQTYENWELVLVDDGSTDPSSEIARKYSESQPTKIRYVEHPGHANRGVTVSRNVAIRHCRGAYVALLDVDDQWLPGKLSQQVALMEANPEAIMIFGASLYWRSWTGTPEDADADAVREIWTAPDRLVQPPTMLKVSYPLGKGGAPCPSDLLLRKRFVEAIGGFVEEFVGIYQLFEDQAFLAKVYLNGAVFVSSQCWTRYRVHEDSCVSTVKQAGHYHRVRLYYLKWLKAYLRAAGVKDPQIRRTLDETLRRYDPPLVRWLFTQARRAKRLLRTWTHPHRRRREAASRGDVRSRPDKA